MAKRKVFTREQLIKDARAVYDVLNSESDLACVLIGAAYLDSVLANLINTKLRDSSSVSSKLLDSTTGGALSSYQSRTDLAYCLSLINEAQYQDLCKIGEIRNLFAHNHLHLSFSEPGIQEKCGQLHDYEILRVKKEILGTLSEEQARMTARNQFNISLTLLVQMLLLAAGTLEKSRKSEPI